MAKTLEQSFERLEEIIAQMEKSDTTLDLSLIHISEPTRRS